MGNTMAGNAWAWALLWPEVALVAAFIICIPLLAGSGRQVGWVSLLGVAASFGLTVLRASSLEADTVLLGEGLMLRSAYTPFLLVVDGATLVSMLWSGLRHKGLAAYPAYLMLALAMGCHLLVLAASPLAMVLGVEMISLASYALVAWPRSEASLRAALRFALLGMAATACLLYGLSWAYGAQVQHAPVPALALVLAGVAVLFKLGAFPLHGWVADAYAATPPAQAALISVAPKAAAACWAISLLDSMGPGVAPYAAPALLGAGVLSVAAGNVGAFFQDRFMRLMAFSSVAHSGFLLLCLGADATLHVAAYYVLALIGINYLGIGLWDALRRMGGGPTFASISGWGQGRHWLAALAVVAALALAGLPPTFGFLAKLKLVLGLAGLQATLGAQVAYGLAAFAAINTAISLGYYLKLPYYLIFRNAVAQPDAGRVDRIAATALALLGLALLGLFFVGGVV